MTTQIQLNDTEKLLVTAIDADGNFLTGLSDVLLTIKRKSDGAYLDFSDNTFKTLGLVNVSVVMAETDVALFPGSYFYDFDTTGLPVDTYFMRATSVTAANMPQEGDLQVVNLNLQLADISTVVDNNNTTVTQAVADISIVDSKLDATSADVTTVIAQGVSTDTKVSAIATDVDSVALQVAAVESEVDGTKIQIDELHKLQGLDTVSPLTVTPTSRTAGTIAQTITGDGETTSTVTRT